MNEQTKLEMERGRIIAGRAKRHSDLTRYMAARKVTIVCASPGNPVYQRGPSLGETHLFFVNGVQIAHEYTWQDDYPSEALMAKIAMCVAATVGFEGIKSDQTINQEVRRQRDVYVRNHIKNWGDGNE